MLDKEILVVDDERDLLAMTRSIFEGAGYTQVETAASAEDALRLISKKNARHLDFRCDDAGHGWV